MTTKLSGYCYNNAKIIYIPIERQKNLQVEKKIYFDRHPDKFNLSKRIWKDYRGHFSASLQSPFSNNMNRIRFKSHESLGVKIL